MSTAPEEQQLLLTPVLMLFPCNFRATFEFWHTRRILPSQCSFFSMRWHNSWPSPLQVLWCHFGVFWAFSWLWSPQILPDEANICFVCYTNTQRGQCSKLLQPHVYTHTFIHKDCSQLTVCTAWLKMNASQWLLCSQHETARIKSLPRKLKV